MDKTAVYEEQFRLRVSDFDTYDRLTPSAVLDLSQDIAGKHADILHIGFDDFIKNNRIWVLLRTRFKMISHPHLYDTVKVRTWPREKGRADFDRDTIIENLDGTPVALLQSKWAIVDVNERRLVLPRSYDYPLNDLCKDKTFDSEFKRLEDFSIEGLSRHDVETQFLDLDHNGHINNIHYAQYIMNIIKPKSDLQLDYFEIDYIHELKENQILSIYVKEVDGGYYIKGCTEEQNVFLAYIVFAPIA